MKTQYVIAVTAIVLNGCAFFEADKTPLSPHGQLNVCLRDDINDMKVDGRLESFGKAAVAQKAARYCLDKLKMTDAFSQDMAYRNADFLLSGSDGISLK